MINKNTLKRIIRLSEDGIPPRDCIAMILTLSHHNEHDKTAGQIMQFLNEAYPALDILSKRVKKYEYKEE